MDEVTLRHAPPSEEARIARMVNAYLDEMGIAAPIARASVPLYWRQPSRVPFLVLADGAVAGFALVRDTGEGFLGLAEFSVLPGWRDRGIGAMAAALVFAQFPGPWRLKAVPKAERFWRRQLAGRGARELGGGWFAFNAP
ncbi:GNAT family N-acetyltransferase [Acidimangrovimonas sediminis]|uniref:GNAT family N-acetyltransferase n=1 Tax=Acidimangrovimonas sediminis TaxID=2056283 RepID=UPI000C7FE389|nr:GNAT family N-acetyltransferase [Acidimangrovimonas sediminis]